MAIGIWAVAIILWCVLIFWTWNNLKALENNASKIVYIVLSILILGIITFIIFNISKSGVQYPKANMISPVRKMILMIFIPINGFISMTYIASQIGRLEIGEIDSNKFRKKVIAIIIIFAIILLFEFSYFKNIQNGIVNIYKIS